MPGAQGHTFESPAANAAAVYDMDDHFTSLGQRQVDIGTERLHRLRKPELDVQINTHFHSSSISHYNEAVRELALSLCYMQ